MTGVGANGGSDAATATDHGMQKSRWRVVAALGCALLLLGAGIGIGAALWSDSSSEVADDAGARPLTPRQQAALGGSRHTVEGDVAANSGDHRVVDCKNQQDGVGPYVMSVDNKDRGTIFDSLLIDTTGTDSRIWPDSEPWRSVAWGHIGSRLVTAVNVGATAAPYDNYEGKRHWKITVWCTSNQSEAWVIAG